MIKYCRTGWSGKTHINDAIAPYWEAREDLTLHGNLLLYGSRVVVPASKQLETIQKIHEGHQGIQRCRLRARISVWWPVLSRQIEEDSPEAVKMCSHCARESIPRKEPLMPSALPDYPWQKIGSDLFLLNGKTYLIAIDYFS